MKALCSAFFLFFIFPAFATSLDTLSSPVNDYAHLLNSEEKANINRFLDELNRKTGIQIAVLTVNSLEGEDIESFSIKVSEKWKLGQKGKDNGAIVVVALKEHKVRLEVGYGLESTLTDAQCGLIIRNIVAPYFRNGEYGKGISGAVQAMARLSVQSDEFFIDDSLASGIETDESEEAGKTASILFFLIMLMLSLIYGHARRRSFAHDPYGARRMVRDVAVASLLSSFLRSSSGRFSGGFDDFKGGGSSGSGFGGFSGGGGGFGGGGASGSW